MQNYIKYKLTFLLFLIFYLNVGAQQEMDLYFDYVEHDENFAQGMVSSMVQTKIGFIWIGTNNGLMRYDGYNFVRYIRDVNSEGSISNNHVNVIFEDSSGNLWIGTNNGVNLFNRKANNFTEIDILSIKGGRNYISSMVEDGNGNLWVGTFGGVKLLNQKTKRLEDVSNNPNTVLFNQSRVLSLFYEPTLGMLAGTSKGLKSFDPSTGLSVQLPDILKNNKTFSKAKIQKIVKEGNGNIWFATESNGVYMYSLRENELVNYQNDFNNKNTIASNWVSDILPVDENTLWFATNNGLSIYDKAKNEFNIHVHNPLKNFSVSDNDIKCFLKDRSGSVWLGTAAGGINFYNKSNANFVNVGEALGSNFGMNNHTVNSLVTDDDGSLWVGTYGGGLNHLDFKHKKSEAFLIPSFDRKKKTNMITALEHLDAENLLCGTLNGLFRFNKKRNSFDRISLLGNESIVEERAINKILSDEESVWVATDGNGLIRIGENGESTRYTADGSLNAISDNFVVDIERDGNKLWIATQDGLNLLDIETDQFLRTYRNEGDYTLSNNTLTELFRDSEGRLWIGCDYGGLNYFDENSQKFYVLNKALGFTDEAIQSIVQDAAGDLWVSSDNMLFKIKILNFQVPFEAADFEITSYSSSDGLSVRQFSNHCSQNLNNNEIVFGGFKGLVIFKPEDIIKELNQSDIVFTKLRVNNEEVKLAGEGSPLKNWIAETSEITLSHNEGYVGLEFSALNFINPKSNRYSYKLDSQFNADDWHDLGTQNSVNLTALNPGTYDFQVRTSNEEGVWNPKINSLKIEILPPWWRTWWAHLSYVLILLTISVLIVRFIKIRIQLKRALLFEQFEKERQQEMYKLKLDFFTNISHEIRTPLTLISGPVEDLLEHSEKNTKLEKKLQIIKHNSDRLLKLVNELLDFRKAEKGRMKIHCEKQDIMPFCFEIYESFKGISVEKNIDYKFVINTNSIMLYFDKNQMEKVIYNLLSNAFKFTKKNGKIVLSIEQRNQDEGWVDIKIKDNGIGIPENSKKNIFKSFFQVDNRGVQNQGSGVGLALSKSIVELHSGEISIPVETESWASTVFQISLQKGKKHLKKSQIVEKEISVEEVASDLDESKKTPVIFQDDFVIPFEAEDDHRKFLLVVDDNEEVRKFIADVLQEDYRIKSFSSGSEAISFMEKEIPDLVISDVMMPEMDGFELCKLIKTNESTNHIPVILLTAKSSTSNRIAGLSTGADSYITKPFSIKVLKLNILNLLSTKEILRQKFSGRFIVDSDLEKLTTPEEVFIKKLMEIIEMNIENPNFDVNELVKEIGMSRTVLYKKVQTLTNHSVASLIKHIRLKKAADILMNTNYPISEITYMVGFNDRKHFSREFKKVYKLSPTAYKSAIVAED